MSRWFHLTLLLASSSMLAACAASSNRYPTLEIREAERISGTFEVADPVQPAPLGADIATDLPELEASARAAHARFLEAVPNTRRLVAAASGSTTESNAWAAAQIALADLISLHSDMAVSLAELDLKYADATLRFEQREAVSNALKTVAGLMEEEGKILAEINGGLTP